MANSRDELVLGAIYETHVNNNGEGLLFHRKG